jgi:Na+/proline symporter
MGDLLTAVDVAIFFGSLIAVMGIGLWAGRKEETSSDYYLAGKTTRWWGVAGSIFGSNVSANHIIGFVGLGFSVGFAQSHFEITAIAGLLLLCYGFLPMYRKLDLYTLSQYLGRRYDDRSRILYALIMVVVMVIIQMVPGFYIGSRSLNILLQGGPGPIDPTWYKLGIILMALPMGWGLLGLVAAGMIGAILSSLDSMMNSSATIVTFDLYQRYVNPQASEKRLIWVGRSCVVAFIAGAACLTIFYMDPNSEESFFLHIVDHQSRLVAGLVVAFALGMLWKRATAAGALAAIVSGVVLSYALPPLYASFLGTDPRIAGYFGREISFLHTVAVVAVLCVIVQVTVSLLTQPDEEKAKLTWVGQGIFRAATLRSFAVCCGISLALYAVLAVAMVGRWLSPTAAAWLAAGWTLAVFIPAALRNALAEAKAAVGLLPLVRQDRFWAGVLAAAAVFMMYYFY